MTTFTALKKSAENNPRRCLQPCYPAAVPGFLLKQPKKDYARYGSAVIVLNACPKTTRLKIFQARLNASNNASHN